MFTGIIKELGIIKNITDNNGSKTFVVEAPTTVIDKKIGDSISVDGACHTVTHLENSTFSFISIPETLKLTTLDSKKPGDKVNLEGSLKIGETLDGHLVTGHIDTTTPISEIIPQGDSKIIKLQIPQKIAKFIAYKGSICINGISLTVSEVTDETFSVSIIPHTWENTNLHTLKAESSVNIEIDTIARYLERFSKFQ